MGIEIQTELIRHPKLRKLAKAIRCSNHEALGILFSLWTWGQINSDSFGKMPDTERCDIERCLIGDAGNSTLDMANVVDALIDTGWIDEGKDGELTIHDWVVWQADWYLAKEKRKSEAQRKREQRKKEDVLQETACKSCDCIDAPPLNKTAENSIQEQPISQPQSKKNERTYNLSFEEFWSVYPRKEDKAYAYKQYKARLKDGWSENELLRAAKNYAYVCEKKRTENEYIKKGKAFLSEATPFTDYIPKEKPPVSQTPDAANPFAEFKDD